MDGGREDLAVTVRKRGKKDGEKKETGIQLLRQRPARKSKWMAAGEEKRGHACSPLSA